MRLSDGNRAEDPLGRLVNTWNEEEQRARAARVMEAIAASAAGHVRRLGRRADGTSGPSRFRKIAGGAAMIALFLLSILSLGGCATTRPVVTVTRDEASVVGCQFIDKTSGFSFAGAANVERGMVDEAGQAGGNVLLITFMEGSPIMRGIGLIYRCPVVTLPLPSPTPVPAPTPAAAATPHP